MREVLEAARAWWAAGERFALGTVAATWRSAPRPAGATMAVGPDGTVVGSVSGGCVEGAVYELGRDVIDSGEPVFQRFGVSDDDAAAVGLTCGGILDVLVAPVDAEAFGLFEAVADSISAERPVALATIVDGPAPLGARLAVWETEASGSLGNPSLDAVVAAEARALLGVGETRTLRTGPRGELLEDDVTVLVEVFAPTPRMIVFGAIDFARATVRIGKVLGYHVTVCDARPLFATPARFPEADEVVVDWPHRYLAGTTTDERTVLCVLTHDPKFDVPLLEVALRGPAAYVGAMGSRRTHRDRLDRLREVGVTDAELARLRSPIGLDLGARTPEETAVSIAAEIVGLHRGGTGRPLTELEGPIHAGLLRADPPGVG
ncbi:XdhC family protein [Nocardioides zeae]|uniref:Xanthine dehydrogenase accessory factor n=1 Tax=Nocardioides zeae TaxID=1457234 RepID=A0AAJ1U483_9ACTN|nr:XdhC/CoxI family protein [Nocardioides zeae]MDQ1105288.1 xanthine dehydrogenase accessory factor [Nocardioides zeae]